MTHQDVKTPVPDSQDTSQALYHEAQADGVPYDEDLEPFTKEAAKHEVANG